MSKLLTLEEIIAKAQHRRASDIHIVCGIPIRLRVDGRLVDMDDNVMTAADCESYARDLSNHYDDIAHIGEQDLALGFADGTRCRVNLFRQQGYVSAAIRILNNHIPAFEELGLPSNVANFTEFNQGIVLVTGETGSGKSTTLACLLDKINHTQPKHIITLEDPVEYIYTPDKCIINQREVGDDTDSFAAGLRAALRQDPDVILVGEMRDLETISTAITAAETGHLVFGTLHTKGAANTIDRIVDVFPPEQQEQVRIQLADVLECVVSKALLPRIGGGRVAAYEILVATPAVRSLIRQNKSFQITSAMQTGKRQGMQLLDDALAELVRTRQTTLDDALAVANDPAALRAQLGRF